MSGAWQGFDNLRAIWCASLALMAIGAGSPALGQGPPPSPVRVEEARMENVQERRRVTGDLRAVARSRVATNEGGIVIDLPVLEGQLVKRGDVVARLDGRRLKLQFERFQAEKQVALANVTEQEAEVEISRRDLGMLQELDARGASNPKELADARSEFKADEARLGQAQRQYEVIKAQADLLQVRLDDTTIVAPFDGVVVARHTEVGEWIGEGDAVIELLATGAYDAWLDVPQRFAPALIGTDAELMVVIEAVERTIGPVPYRVVRQVDEIARTFAVVVRIPDEANGLASGMSVIAWAPTGRAGEHLTIHKDALLKNPTDYFVYVVREGNSGGFMAMPAVVQIEFDLGPKIAVTSRSLRPGDRIVIEGNERLYPTAPVTIATPPAPEGEAP